MPAHTAGQPDTPTRHRIPVDWRNRGAGGPRARLLRLLLIVVALLASSLTVLTVSTAPAKADTPLNTPFITWNMRGGTTAGTFTDPEGNEFDLVTIQPN